MGINPVEQERSDAMHRMLARVPIATLRQLREFAGISDRENWTTPFEWEGDLLSVRYDGVAHQSFDYDAGMAGVRYFMRLDDVAVEYWADEAELDPPMQPRPENVHRALLVAQILTRLRRVQGWVGDDPEGWDFRIAKGREGVHGVFWRPADGKRVGVVLLPNRRPRQGVPERLTHEYLRGVTSFLWKKTVVKEMDAVIVLCPERKFVGLCGAWMARRTEDKGMAGAFLTLENFLEDPEIVLNSLFDDDEAVSGYLMDEPEMSVFRKRSDGYWDTPDGHVVEVTQLVSWSFAQIGRIVNESASTGPVSSDGRRVGHYVYVQDPIMHEALKRMMMDKKSSKKASVLRAELRPWPVLSAEAEDTAGARDEATGDDEDDEEAEGQEAGAGGIGGG